MTTGDLLNEWLAAANRRYAAEGLPHKTRPFRALSDYTAENKCSLTFDHPIAKAMFEWFYAHSPPGAHHVGSIYEGVYYYDATFWPVSVPIIFGTVSVNALDCLITMPEQIKQQLSMSPGDASSYAEHWINCMDYGYGHSDIEQMRELKPKTMSLLAAADGEIRGAASQLLEQRPNLKAKLNLRMAVEIFLKALLVEKLDLAEKDLKAISHNLSDAAKTCAEATEIDDFATIQSRVSIFPSISSRYEAPDWPASAVWEAAALAQFTAAAVARCLGGRNLRRDLFHSQ